MSYFTTEQLDIPDSTAVMSRFPGRTTLICVAVGRFAAFAYLVSVKNGCKLAMGNEPSYESNTHV